jgi:hypothetical protein
MVRRKRGEAGQQVIEFALFTMVLVPLLLGTFVIGMNLARSILVAQIGRDAGSMYVRGVDFSETANQAVLVRLGQRLGMAVAGGKGVVILSKITFIPSGGCTMPCNAGQYVITQRITIGNASVRSSSFPFAGAVSLNAHGDVANYVTDPNAVSSGFGSTLTLKPGEFVYVSEAYFPSPDLDLPGLWTGTGVYAATFY